MRPTLDLAWSPCSSLISTRGPATSPRDLGVPCRADAVWITEIYPAREPAIPGVDGALVAREVEGAVDREGHRAREVRFHGELGSLPAELAQELRPGDLCLTLGAGSIERVGAEVLQALRTRTSGPGSYDA